MKFTGCTLTGAYLIDVEPRADERGFFARSFCAEEFAARGLAAQMSQSSVSFNARARTLRGLHWQAAPHEEQKLVRCTAGAIFDVIVDLRETSSTYRGWFGVELTAANRRALYVPKGFAHGFLTLSEASEVLYMISTAYQPGFDRGVRWDDPAIGIAWPQTPAVISPRDASLPRLGES
jgi:dTDP-4-dehydrorhamnose 3,5-epimerase